MRIRAIKPGYFKSEELAELPPLYRIAFAGLWCCADRDGRIEDRPKRLKAEILPYDEVDFEVVLDTLSARGFIERYVVKSQSLIRIPNWHKHQHPRPDEGKSTLPGPTDTGPPLDSDESVTPKRIGSGEWEGGSGKNPPTPLAGGRVTRADRERAKEIRSKQFGCRHEPRCEQYSACVEVMAQELADQRITA